MFRRFKKTVQRINSLIFLRENNGRIALSFLISLGGMASSYAAAFTYSETLGSLSSNQSVKIGGMEFSPPEFATLAYGGSVLIYNLISNLRNLILTPVSPHAEQQLVSDYMDALMDQTLEYHRTVSSGEHINLLTKAFISVPSVTSEVFSQIIPTIEELIIAGALLSKWYGAEVGLGLAGIVFIYAGYNMKTKQQVTQLRDVLLLSNQENYDDSVRMINYYETIHTFNNLPNETQKFKKSLKQCRSDDAKLNEKIYKIGMTQSLITGLGFMGLCFFASRGVTAKKFTVADFIIMIDYLQRFFSPLPGFGIAVNQLVSALTDLEVVFKFLETQPQIVDRFPDKDLELKENQAEITFQNVSFAYPSKPDVFVLNNVSFTLKPGTKVGIVGTSGSGKSTVGNLIFRFYDPTQGKILLNGIPINEIGLYRLRKKISMIPQTPVLFNDSIQNNIAYGGLCHGEVELDEIKNALQLACLDQFVESLPEKLQSNVGENGSKISGGQRQRIAFARAILKLPQIIISDEGTSALDAGTARKINQNMRRAFPDATWLTITHRLSELTDADNILVFDKGKIAEQGTHQQLIAKENGIYLNLWKLQNKPKTHKKPSQRLFCPAGSENKSRHLDVIVHGQPQRSLLSREGIFTSNHIEIVIEKPEQKADQTPDKKL